MEITDQSTFSGLLSKFILNLQEDDYLVTFGETFRPQFVEDIYFEKGLSHTHNSFHTKRLAADLNIFHSDGTECSAQETSDIGLRWESMHPKNVWGGRFQDKDHYQSSLF